MTTDATVSLDAIDTALAGARPRLTPDAQRLAVAVYRLLATGRPVRVDQAAAAANVPGRDAERIAHEWSAVYWDEHDAIVGFWGLTVEPIPPHRLRVAGADLSAWCAFDPLFLARILGDMEVSTADPITGDAISYRIGSDATITDLSHEASVLSFLRPDRPWDDNVQAEFCHFVHHFAAPKSAAQWIGEHPGTFIITLGDAVELARRHVGRAFGSALQTGGSHLR